MRFARFVPSAVQAAIVAIAVYLALLWGLEALYVLTSPIYGLGDYGRSQIVFGYGRLFGLSADGLFRLAAFFAASKLAAAIALTLHLVERVRALAGERFDHEMLEAALLIVVFLTVAMAVPAIIENNGNLIQLHAIYLLLAGIVALLSAIERLVIAATDPPATRAGRLSLAKPAILAAVDGGTLRTRALL
jgi:hypothetical protein